MLSMMYSLKKWFYKPRKDDMSYLSQFYFADESLNLIASELDSFDGKKDPERCSTLVNHLRQCQDKVLTICNRIMDEMIPNERADRHFRVKFPDDVMQENLAGQLWFGAECLAAGSSIMNRELESCSMRPLAKALTKSLELVRGLLREAALRGMQSSNAVYTSMGASGIDPLDPLTRRLIKALKLFDMLLANFELTYVSAMVRVKSVEEYELQQTVIVLFSETLIRALHIGLLTQEQVDQCDPALMFTIPRLAIVAGLLIFPHGPLSSLESCKEAIPDMFWPFRMLLFKIRELLWTLSNSELRSLEKMLCSSEEPLLPQENQPLPSLIKSTNSANDIDWSVLNENNKSFKKYKPSYSSANTQTDSKDFIEQPNNSEPAISPTSTSRQYLVESSPTPLYLSNLDVDSNFNSFNDCASSNYKFHEYDNNLNKVEDRLREYSIDEFPSTSTDQYNWNVPVISCECTCITCKQCPSNAPHNLSKNNASTNDNFPLRDDDDLRYYAKRRNAVLVAASPQNCDKKREKAIKEFCKNSSKKILNDNNLMLNKNTNCHTEANNDIKDNEINEARSLTVNKYSKNWDVLNKSVSSSNEQQLRSENNDNYHNGSPTSSSSNSDYSISDSSVSTSETSSYHSDLNDEVEVSLAINAISCMSSLEARSRFKSSEDLLHRLFVCISGVADQLQTNFAGDFRNILKSVFLMNTSDKSDFERETNNLPAVEACEDVAVAMCEDSPPSWVRDEDATGCMACEAPFTVIRRRHHCRNCGKIFCARCSSNSVPLPHYGHLKSVRVCNRCYVYQVTPFTRSLSEDIAQQVTHQNNTAI